MKLFLTVIAYRITKWNSCSGTNPKKLGSPVVKTSRTASSFLSLESRLLFQRYISGILNGFFTLLNSLYSGFAEGR
jgi:hypothetical protein